MNKILDYAAILIILSFLALLCFMVYSEPAIAGVMIFSGAVAWAFVRIIERNL